MTYEIGKWYRVPAVRGRVYEHTRWWPTLGPKHEDAELIKFPHQHYHIDWRFVPQRVFQSLASWSDKSSVFAIPLMEGTEGRFGEPPINHLGLGKPQPIRMKCVRELPEYPRARALRNWLHELESAYTGCKLKPGMICPHRGIPLATVPAVDGVVTCPGHGLRWNVATGELVPAPPQAAAEKGGGE